MDIKQLQKFNLCFPGHWIAGEDRDWAFEIALLLSQIEEEFVCAVASFAMFEPITIDNAKEYSHFDKTKYERCLNGIYASSFVLSLDAISKILEVLKNHLHPPCSAVQYIFEYESNFGELKFIRDSIAHIEDRIRGVDKNQRIIPTNILILGSFNERRFGYTGSDRNLHEIEIAESTLFTAQRIIQKIINAYNWE